MAHFIKIVIFNVSSLFTLTIKLIQGKYRLLTLFCISIGYTTEFSFTENTDYFYPELTLIQN